MRDPLRVRYANAAIDDLRKIARDLAKARGTDFADQYVDTLVNSVAKLAEYPKRYRERARYGVGRRLFPLRPYNVFYVVEVDCVRILRIVHGRRRITKRQIGPGG